MSKGDDVRRRIALLTVLAATLSIAALLPARAAGSPYRHARLNVTGVRVSTPTGLPTPDAGDRIGPGSPLLIDLNDNGPVTALCTANFVWQSSGTYYLGAAGHCFLPQNGTVVKGRDPYVSRVRVCVASCLLGGASQLYTNGITGDFRDLGPVVYARQTDGKGNDVGHDFGVVQIPSGLLGFLRPAVPVWGGPSGSETASVGTPACLYGNAAGLGEVFATKARAGVIVPDLIFDEPGAWFAAMPSFEGDSGSAVVDCATGAAIGILTHITTNGIAGTTVARAIEMAREAHLSLSIVQP